MSFRLRTQINYPVIARIAGVHISFLDRGIACFLPSSRYYDTLATYIEVKNAAELEMAQTYGATMFMKITMDQVKGVYFDTKHYTHYLPSEITTGPIKKPKMLVLGANQDSFVESLFNFSTDHRQALDIETWGFSRDASQFDHWTPGANKEDEDDVNSSTGRHSNDFPSKTSMVHNADGTPECFDFVALALQNWSNRSCYMRDNLDWSEGNLRTGGVMILSGKHYHLKHLARVFVSRFESIQIFSHNEHTGIFNHDEVVTMVGIKKAKRTRDDAFTEILETALKPDLSGYGMKQLLSPLPYHRVYPPENITIVEEKKLFDDSHLIEMEEVEAMLTPGECFFGIDTFSVRQKVEGIIECKMAVGSSFGYHVKLKGSSVPMMRQVCSELDYKVRFKGEKSRIDRTLRQEARNTDLASNLSPVILSKEVDHQYMSLFAHESPLRLHSGLLQKKTELNKLVLPVPPKITNLTKLTQHLRGIVQGPDNHWLATKGYVETVKTHFTTEIDGQVQHVSTSKKRVKQVGILLDGPDKGALIEVEAA